MVLIEHELKNAYIGEYKPIYKGEYIEYKMNADSSGNLYVPISGINHNGDQSTFYNWLISVDGGSGTAYSGQGYQSGYLTLNGYTANTSHIIKITPTTESYGWALSYGWTGGVSGKTNLTEIIYDSSYMGYAVSATDTGDDFRTMQYYGCTNLTNPVIEYLPDTVTTIGNYFMSRIHHNCSSLAYSYDESLPDSVTSIGANFRYRQYDSCSQLTEIKGWKDLSIGNSSYYRYRQYYNCTSNKTVKVLSDVGYSAYDSSALDNSYVTSVSVPNSYLTSFKNTSNQPRANIDDSKFIGY